MEVQKERNKNLVNYLQTFIFRKTKEDFCKTEDHRVQLHHLLI